MINLTRITGIMPLMVTVVRAAFVVHGSRC